MTPTPSSPSGGGVPHAGRKSGVWGLMLRSTIQSAMSARAMTIADLARASGVHRVTLSRWLSGKREMTTTSLERVLSALGLVVAPRSGVERPPVIT